MSSHNRIYLSRPVDRRRFLGLVGGGIAGAALLGACGRGETAQAGQASNNVGIASDVGVMKAGYDNPNYSHHMADVVAYEKGYLKDAGFTGLSDDIINDAMAAIIGGGLMWSASDTDVIVNAAVKEGVPISYLGTRRDREDEIFGLAPGVTIDDLKNSKGALVSGGEVGRREELIGKKVLASLGVPEDAVKWVAMGGGSDNRLVALLNGQLKGSSLQVRHIAPLGRGGGTIAYNQSRPIAQDGYIAKNDFIKDHEAAVTAYLWAIIKAKQYLKNLDTKDEVIEMLKKHDFEFNQDFVDAYADNVKNLSADCGFEVDQVNILFEELAETGEGDANIDWRKAMNLNPLWKAQEAAGLPRRPASL